MRTFISLMMLLAACVLGPVGCTSTGPRTAAGDLSMHAECLVCKYNADLACVDVPVTDDTPRTVYQGKTYYFCSAECKHEFEKYPAKYIAQ